MRPRASDGDASFIDAFVIAQKLNDRAWKVYHWNWSSADGWNPNIESIGGALVAPHPVSKVAAVCFTVAGAQYIDVFIVGSDDGFLYYSRRKNRAWSDFAPIGTGEVTIASVDEAILRPSPNTVDVVATGRDGNVYVATSNNSMTGYGQLTRITKLDLGAI